MVLTKHKPVLCCVEGSTLARTARPVVPLVEFVSLTASQTGAQPIIGGASNKKSARRPAPAASASGASPCGGLKRRRFPQKFLRRLGAFYRLAQKLRNGFKQKRIVLTGETDRGAQLPRPPGSADPVHIIFGLFGQSKIHHVADAADMNSPARHVGGHENFQTTIFKGIQRRHSLVLRNFAGQQARFDLMTLELILQIAALIATVGKNDQALNIVLLNQVV